MSTYTTKAELDEAYSTLFQTFGSGITKSLAWRKWQLKQVWWMVADHEKEIIDALHQDLHRHEFESYASDLVALKGDILEHIKHLEKWAADEKPDAGFIFGTLGKSRIRKEPLGVALIIGAWNYPFFLAFSPMVAAIAAGNCVMLKPSELAAASQDLMVKLAPQYLDQSAIRIVTGGPAETAKILERKFNHIFFTGSNTIARYITAAAAKHLTPTVLELGGQGPAIVTANANIELSAKRIALAKFLNAGQICLSINHVFVDPSIYDKFIERLGFWLKEITKDKSHMARIINDRNYERLASLLEKSKGKIAYGGELDKASKYISPTIVTDVNISDSLLSSEIFGPLLPIIKSTYVEAYKTISSMDHALAIYIFSEKQAEVDEVLNNTNSGGVMVNDFMLHAAVPNAPFGGVGESGYGAYHGKYGFEAFSHRRTVLQMPNWMEGLLSFRYPPFNLAANLGKVQVKNNLGFKRGETMADQKIGQRKLGLFALVPASVLVAIIARVLSQDGGKWYWEVLNRGKA